MVVGLDVIRRSRPQVSQTLYFIMTSLAYGLHRTAGDTLFASAVAEKGIFKRNKWKIYREHEALCAVEEKSAYRCSVGAEKRQHLHLHDAG